MYFLLVVCSKNNSTLHRFWDVITLTLNYTWNLARSPPPCQMSPHRCNKQLKWPWKLFKVIDIYDIC